MATKKSVLRRLGEKSKRVLEEEEHRLAAQIIDGWEAVDKLSVEVGPLLRQIFRKLGIRIVGGKLKFPRSLNRGRITTAEFELFRAFYGVIRDEALAEDRDMRALRVITAALSTKRGRPESISPEVSAALQEYDSATGRKLKLRHLSYRHSPVQNEVERKKFIDKVRYRLKKRRKRKTTPSK